MKQQYNELNNTQTNLRYFNMAENKKSVLVYTDLIHVVEGLEDEEAGRLLKHLLRYVNDLNPDAPDRLTSLLFEPIKQQFKRDLKKWEGEKERYSKGGKASAEARRLKCSTSLNDDEQASTVSTVTDTVTVNVTDTVNVTVTDKKKKREKKPFLPPSLFDFENYFIENGFSKELAQRVFKSYDVAEWIDARGNPVLNWKQKCQTVWFKEENKEKVAPKNFLNGTGKQSAEARRDEISELKQNAIAKIINGSAQNGT
jgi:hypothetical protein